MIFSENRFPSPIKSEGSFFRDHAPAVDLATKSVYVAARNLVFGLILLTRSRLWAAAQVTSQNSDCCRQRDARADVQREV
jgi:hypothetical protein